jgi:hypothetical protein
VRDNDCAAIETIKKSAILSRSSPLLAEAEHDANLAEKRIIPIQCRAALV